MAQMQYHCEIDVLRLSCCAFKIIIIMYIFCFHIFWFTNIHYFSFKESINHSNSRSRSEYESKIAVESFIEMQNQESKQTFFLTMVWSTFVLYFKSMLSRKIVFIGKNCLWWCKFLYVLIWSFIKNSIYLSFFILNVIFV